MGVGHRHEGRPQKVEIPIEITEKEADRQSLLNVEGWVGAHIVPILVSARGLSGPDRGLSGGPQ